MSRTGNFDAQNFGTENFDALQRDHIYELQRREFLDLMAKCGMAVGIGGAAFIAPSNGLTQGRGRRGGTLIIALAPEPPNLASFSSTANPTSQIGSKLYDGLLEYDFELKPIPSLAKNWKVSDDGKEITFTLREDVKFHDGKPFTSADVQFSVMDVLKKVHPRGPNTFSAVLAVETPDPHTAIFKLSEPAPYLFAALSGYESPMLPKHLMAGTDLRTTPLINKPVGTGPFRFVEWRRGEYIRLDRNANYWKKERPYLDRIVARFINSSQTRAAAMQAGEVHFGGFTSINFSDAKRLTANGIRVETKGYEMFAPIAMLEMNTTRGPLKDQRVRQAISYAINRQFVIDNVWFGFGKPATGPISSSFDVTGMYTSNVKKYQVSNGVELANKLLDEAGYHRSSDGLRFSITHDLLPFGEDWKRFGEYVKQVLGQIGIAVTLRYEDFPTFIRRVFTDYDFDMTSDYLFCLSDPVIGVHRLYASWNIRKGTPFVNCSRWSSPRTDEIMKAAAIESDPSKRNKLYHEFQQLVVEAAPVVWVAEVHSINVYNPKFHDILSSPLGSCGLFDQAWRES